MTKTVARDFNALVAAKLSALRSGNTYDTTLLGKLADSIRNRAKTLDVDIHAAGVAAINVAMQHGDATAAAKVANSLGQHTRSKTFASWIEAHSNVVLVLKDGVWSGKLRPADARMDQTQMEDAAAKALGSPFWLIPEKGTRDFSLHAALAALLKRADKAEGLSAEDEAALSDLRVLTTKLEPVKA